MKEFAAAFIEEVKSKGHLVLLLKNVSFSLCINGESDKIPLRFRNGEIMILSSEDLHTFDVTLSGSDESIHSILCGRQKLREAIKTKEITIKSAFRKVLFLESLFYLSASKGI